MSKKNIKKNKGFVILFAVTVSSILLAISLGISNIAIKEIKFSTSAKDTNDAFLAADTGIEYALFHDKGASDYVPAPGTTQTWDFNVYAAAGGGVSCARVSVTKDDTVSPMATTIVSKGYNIGDETCSSPNPDRIERELTISY